MPLRVLPLGVEGELTRLSTFALCFNLFHADNFKSPTGGVEFGRLLLPRATEPPSWEQLTVVASLRGLRRSADATNKGVEQSTPSMSFLVPSRSDGTPCDAWLTQVTAVGGCVAPRRNKEVPTAIGRQSPWGFGDAASSRVKCAKCSRRPIA